MTTAHHTFSNGCVVQIDLDAIPAEARWLTMENSYGPAWCWTWKDRPEWRWCGGEHAWCYTRSSTLSRHALPEVISGTLPPWSECIIDLEEVRNQAEQRVGRLAATALMDETDDGPPRLYDVVALGGGNLALLLEHVGGQRWMGMRIVPVFATETSNVIARNVYDIREAMRLMGETE